MTVPQSTTTAEASLGRLGLNVASHYLGKRWVLLSLGGVAVIIGLYSGGWGWLVAAGLAPVILATLPCLIMCGLGICMMCKQQSAASRDAADTGTSSTALGGAKMDRPTVAGSSCCHEDVSKTQSPQVKQAQSMDERRDTHA